MEILNDNSAMPYGKYKGKKMNEVPPNALLWLYDNNRCSPSVRQYINDNMDVLYKQAGRAVPKGSLVHAAIPRKNRR